MRIDIQEQLPQEAKKNIIEQLYYLHPSVKNCAFKDEALLFEVDAALPEQELRAKVAELVSQTAASFSRVQAKIYFESEGSGDAGDPTAALIKNNDLVENLPGVYLYQGRFLRLMRKLDSLFFALALRLDAREQDCPTTLPLKAMTSNGYLSSFSQHAIFASCAHADHGALEVLRGLKPEGKEADPRPALDVPSQLLAPTVCYHCFEALRGRKIQGNTTFTALAKCHRHERGTLRGLERLQTFTMREIIFYGGEKYVQAGISACVEHSQRLAQTLGVKARIIAATDPFFAGDALKKRAYQSFLGLKKELQLYLPYNGTWLAAGSFNNHRDTLVSKYGIIGGGEGQLFSGCVGYGYERFLLALLAQAGESAGPLLDEAAAKLST